MTVNRQEAHKGQFSPNVVHTLEVTNLLIKMLLDLDVRISQYWKGRKKKKKERKKVKKEKWGSVP